MNKAFHSAFVKVKKSCFICNNISIIKTTKETNDTLEYNNDVHNFKSMYTCLDIIKLLHFKLCHKHPLYTFTNRISCTTKHDAYHLSEFIQAAIKKQRIRPLIINAMSIIVPAMIITQRAATRKTYMLASTPKATERA